MQSKDLVAASAKPLILSILLYKESYGYEIIQTVKKLSGGNMEWTDGMLYPILHRLEAQDLIESTWKTSDEGRKRKYYKIKKEGKTALSAEQKQWNLVNTTLNRIWEDKSCLT
ncbi:MAG: PadR family transcriptional regulator [Ignavibacteria bacterium]